MKNSLKNFVIGLAVFLLIVVFGGFYSFLAKDRQLDLKEVQVGERLFMAEVADTSAKRTKGLSGRANLPENQGMLFVFGAPDIYGFWMKGMRIPLDILWIKGLKVVAIEKNISATSTQVYYPPEPVDRVLEINAGLADKFEIKSEDAVNLKQ